MSSFSYVPSVLSSYLLARQVQIGVSFVSLSLKIAIGSILRILVFAQLLILLGKMHIVHQISPCHYEDFNLQNLIKSKFSDSECSNLQENGHLSLWRVGLSPEITIPAWIDGVALESCVPVVKMIRIKVSELCNLLHHYHHHHHFSSLLALLHAGLKLEKWLAINASMSLD